MLESEDYGAVINGSVRIIAFATSIVNLTLTDGVMKAVTAPLIERVQTQPDLMNHLSGKSKSTKTNYRAADSHGV